MQYIFPAFRPEAEPGMLQHVNNAAGRLANKLASLDLEALSISEASRTLLANKLSNVQATMQVFTYLLTHALIATKRPAEETVLCDYGGGTGLFSFLALEAGVKDMVYVDLMEHKRDDAKALANALGYQLSHTVLGDIEQTKEYLQKAPITPHAICSFDVLEHIYDLDSHFAELMTIVDGPLAYVMCSNANIFNPRIRNQIMRWQVQAETQGYNDRPYPEIRREIIQEHLAKRESELPTVTITALARNTRGQKKEDIVRAVDELLNTGRLPAAPSHPTNTCNPLTGSWLEHLFDHTKLARKIAKQGFESRIEYGLYGASPSKLRAKAQSTVNTVIQNAKPLAKYIAPFFTLVASRD